MPDLAIWHFLYFSLDLAIQTSNLMNDSIDLMQSSAKGLPPESSNVKSKIDWRI
jgi:hypothetical protein